MAKSASRKRKSREPRVFEEERFRALRPEPQAPLEGAATRARDLVWRALLDPAYGTASALCFLAAFLETVAEA